MLFVGGIKQDQPIESNPLSPFHIIISTFTPTAINTVRYDVRSVGSGERKIW